ncbi:energy transducer TonB, partial [Myxococcota bacterium]|nr:energy transducer TonB [Myxococcota bacterium]
PFDPKVAPREPAPPGPSALEARLREAAMRAPSPARPAASPVPPPAELASDLDDPSVLRAPKKSPLTGYSIVRGHTPEGDE